MVPTRPLSEPISQAAPSPGHGSHTYTSRKLVQKQTPERQSSISKKQVNILNTTQSANSNLIQKQQRNSINLTVQSLFSFSFKTSTRPNSSPIWQLSRMFFHRSQRQVGKQWLQLGFRISGHQTLYARHISQQWQRVWILNPSPKPINTHISLQRHAERDVM